MGFCEITAVFLTLVVAQTCAQNSTLARECKLVPSAGNCRNNAQKTFWSYSTKTGGCTPLYGCYSIRDRNVFLTESACQRGCREVKPRPSLPVILPGVPGVTLTAECRINPSPGRCRDTAKRTFWSFSSKTNSCVRITGCYSINDRNIWRTRNLCRRGCLSPVSDPSPSAVLPGVAASSAVTDVNSVSVSVSSAQRGITVAVECRIVAEPGVCLPNAKRTMFTFSGKTGSCVKVYGCYSIRDRNVFLTRQGCRQNCLIRDTDPGQEWRRDTQCLINPSAGRCAESQKRTLWTYSSKSSTCTQIFGCYSVRDRNAFVTLEGCERKCVGPEKAKFLISETAVDNSGASAAIKIARECRIIPTAGQCRDPEKRTFYSYTGKIGDCAEIYGCYGVRDRNVFLTKSGCRRSCFLKDTNTPLGIMEPQCYLNPSAGRCSESQKKTFWSYSSKTMSCTQIYGCYGVRDRNVFLSRNGCEQTCAVVTNIPLPVIPEGSSVSVECRISPSAGRCRPDQKRSFFTYSLKTGLCEQVFGCFSIRDRNVFLTREGCRQNCIVSDTGTPSGVMNAQCYINPSAGRCSESQKRSFWSYSSKISGCTQIFGCYTVNDRNVYSTRNGCERICAVDTNATKPITPTGKLSVECRVTPSAGRCREDQKRAYYSYSSKTGVCTQVYGCYSIRDRNVFLTRDGCNQNCFLPETGQPTGETSPQCFVNPSPGRCAETQKKTLWSYSTKIMECTQIFGCFSVRDRNVFPTLSGCARTCAVNTNVTMVSMPEGYRVSGECRVIPAAGRCREDQKRSYYSYSPKIGVCTEIFGCYSLRDRNVFMTSKGCTENCYISDTAQPSDNMSPQCRLNPSQGRCREDQKRTFWSYSSKTMSCTQIFGCYSIRDRNVFQARDGCERMCAVDTNMTINTLPEGSHLSTECRMIPPPGRCAESQKRVFYSYSTKTGTCTRIYGCYGLRDRNVFLTRERCDQNCFISDTSKPTGRMNRQCFLNPSPGRCSESQRRSVWSYSSKTMTCVQLYGCYSIRDRNVFQTHEGCDRTCVVDTNMTISTLPEGYHLSTECRISPSPGRCKENQKRGYYSYSSKTGTCTLIYGCYSVRDRNVFLTSKGCNQNCFISDTSTASGMDRQCYLNPSPGRCAESQKRTVWSYSSKTMTCTQLYGCYSIRDRNVFQTREGCDRTCAVDTTLPVNPDPGTDVALECRMSPQAGQCRESQKKLFYSYSSKTGACAQIYGCYTIRDRNVFVTSEECRQSCYVTDTTRPPGLDRQCYMTPSSGRCRDSDKRAVWSYSTKTMSCTQLYGCYSIRDRNVFQTRFGCDKMCPVDAIMPTTPAPGTDIALECRLSPSPGRCSESQKRTFYSYSNKIGGCTQIYGCYSLQDRNVFRTMEGCNRNCFLTDTSTPSGIDRQCYLNPSPGRCSVSQQRTYWSYSSKASVCTQIYGCYSIRDRNVFQTRVGCEQLCNVDTSIVPIDPPPGTQVALECRINPSPGSCVNGNRNIYYTYSSKTGGCVQIVGCYSIRDRNVFSTAEECRIGCFTDGTPNTGVDDQCYITASPGRCRDSQKRSYYTFSSKTYSCVEIYGCYSVRDRNVFITRESCNRMCEDNSVVPFDRLTDIPSMPLQSGIRLARECHINPSPGLCVDSQRKTFWSFSTKTNTCTRITGCYDIHDRNTWLTQLGCQQNCFKNDSETIIRETIPLECQLNPTPGRCLPSQKRQFWSYNIKLGGCTMISGCYDFHDRNVWSSLARCENKCSLGNTVTLPVTEQHVAEITTDGSGIRIARECTINPSPGRCLENQMKTFWSFSSKTSSCLRVTGCYNIRDRNTWMDKESCVQNCFINDTAVTTPDTTIAIECKLIPSPGMCLERERKTVHVYSEKLGACTDITGCYGFHDRNVWISREACNNNCHVNASVLVPSNVDYNVALECQMNPTPGRCSESEKRSYFSFSAKTDGCVPLYGCYTINDRNVWLTREGCRKGCIIVRPRPDEPREVAKGCLVNPRIRTCQPNQNEQWWSFDQTTQSCQMVNGCYRLGDRNVFISEKRCDFNCFRTQSQQSHHGISTECRLHPAAGICRPDERRTFWSYSQKTSSCIRMTGCYTIRDRNMWLTREMCHNRCITDSRPRSNLIPNFLAGGVKSRVNGEVRRGRRGRTLSRSMHRVGRTELTADINRNMNLLRAADQGSRSQGSRSTRITRAGTIQGVPVARESRRSPVRAVSISKVVTNLF